ncbi:MAG: hypothetical protein CMC96_10280 [Flavobacteriales bacterium]|nr:hypothetical protein [Flavobacteriales bacterium]|tara:strand:- start:91181 stop:92326 length:1146 start_codon:yes stop_codon:yes gene_type:complete
MKKVLLSCVILILAFTAKAEFINIGVFYSYDIQSFHFQVRAGKYTLYSEQGKVKELDNSIPIRVDYEEGKVKIYEKGKFLGAFDKINFVGVGWYNHFMIQSISPKGLERRYDDNLKIFSQRKKMLLVNNIDLDNYVAGVVEAEVGRKPKKEYFKLQAIICRTYALSNIHKHLMEGINLCDEVHCQAYHGKSFFAPIVEAALQTRGAVIVDSDIQLITAAFHSNCGGQTVNSEDVWTKPLYYLRSVKDTFCLDKRNSVWEKRIDAHRWENYLQAKLPSKHVDSIEREFEQINRKVFFAAEDSGLSFEDLRHQFLLRSTYFGVEHRGNEVLLKGRGYGHGVGLCQEGAMEMAERGYNYAEILHYYYKGVHIIDLSALDFFKED